MSGRCAERAAPAAPDFEALLGYVPRAGLLAERVIAITGAASGIGRALALAASGLGATVIALDRDDDALESLRTTLLERRAPPPDIVVIDLAFATLTDYRSLAERLGRQYGRLDGLVNNAGLIGALSPFEHIDPAVWRQVMAVNLIAPFFLTQWCMPVLRRSPDPVLLFSLDRAARAFWGSYGVAKAGQEALMHIVADEYHALGSSPVRVLGIDPGAVETPGRHLHYPAEPMNVLPSPEAVIGPYLYALGADARGLSNVVLRRAG